jgi:hypothetical protein
MKITSFLFACLLLTGCSSKSIPKINGISFVASREAARQDHIDAILDVHASYAAVMPYGFIRDPRSPEIIFDTERQWFGETRKGARQYIGLLHANRVKVMLKPQLWIRGGEFTGQMEMATETDWKLLERSYERFLLTYARLAEETGVEILCIGTELEQFVQQRPAYWRNLIEKVRETYKGKLTYAANWDEYNETPFWQELDYIGIDAYFPLSEDKTPEIESLLRAWEPWKEGISQLSKSQKRLVIFTEFGYRSMDYTAKQPWQAGREEVAVNMEAQANAKKAIFETFWNEDWFAGGFIWKWFLDHESAGGSTCNRFTPQNKPAQQVIISYYSSY